MHLRGVVPGTRTTYPQVSATYLSSGTRCPHARRETLSLAPSPKCSSFFLQGASSLETQCTEEEEYCNEGTSFVTRKEITHYPEATSRNLPLFLTTSFPKTDILLALPSIVQFCRSDPHTASMIFVRPVYFCTVPAMRSCAQFSANSYTLVHASRRLNAVIFVLTRSAIRPHHGGTIQRARCLSQYEDDDDYPQG